MACCSASSERLENLSVSSRSYVGEAPLLMQALTSGLPLTLSLVVDEFGTTINDQGNSSGIGNQTDLELLKALRLNADVVLTSGKTFRADSYKFPKSADLAVLSRFEPQIAVPVGRRFSWLRVGFVESVTDLRAAGYERIQVEYGASGLEALLESNLPLTLFLSSTSAQGLNIFLRKHDLQAWQLKVNDLFLAVVAWH